MRLLNVWEMGLGQLRHRLVLQQVVPGDLRGGTDRSVASVQADGMILGMYTRQRALQLMEEWTTSESLRKHALAVEACTCGYGEREADRQGLAGDQRDVFVLPYSLAGLLHDFDYDRHPSLEEHPYVGNRLLTEQGWPEAVRHAILAHAAYTGTSRESHLDRVLFACDELSGFLTACALVKPSRSIHDVDPAGVRKKMKDKAFARAVSRDDMIEGAALLDLALEEHIANCLRSLQAAASRLGLEGMAAEA